MVCPDCSQPRSADAVICIDCGLDFRTGKKVAASPQPQHFGDFSLVPEAPGEWLLSVRQRFLGIPLGTQKLQVVGVERVYYDTLDSWTLNVAPTAEPDATRFSRSAMFALAVQLLKSLVAVFYGLLLYWIIIRLSGNSNARLLFEVGFLGPRDRFLRLKQSRNSAKVRAVATWLSASLGVPIERRDRRSPE